MSTQAPERHEFQAEVKQVLDIVVHSLYTDKEIFVRELVSNASDATEKLRHTQITEKEIFDAELELEIQISFDAEAGTITIRDFGIGMSREELVENLGTIAHSGSKAFLNALKEGGGKNENLIGQFGVGFYSVFMVADRVEVFTRSWKSDGESLRWSSDGSGAYEIESAEGERRGTRIVIHLKEEFKEFADKSRLETIVKNYSAFVQFPVKIDGQPVNTVQAIWLTNKSDVTEEEYKEFYKFQAKAFDDPRFWLHFSADAPISIHSLLYAPTENMEGFGFGRMEPGVSLYCRKVLIDSDPKNLLPDWLRFVRGVVDSADLPLNISRESMQDSTLVQKLNKVLTKRFLKLLEEKANKEPEVYADFWSKFGIFLKEGVTTDFTHRDQLLKLLRYESSYTADKENTSLADYLSRAPEGQKEIYYLSGPNRQAIESGPYLEAFKARNIEVLFLLEPIDEFVMNHARSFEEKNFVSADNDAIDLDAIAPDTETEKPEALEDSVCSELCTFLKEQLGDGVEEVSASDRLVGSPAMIVNADKAMTAQMRKMMRAMQQQGGIEDKEPPVKLQINPRHPLIKNLASLRQNDSELAQLISSQILDNARMAAGLLEDPTTMLQRNYGILEKLSERS
ncbi:MAG: molecular chaperone HtpG [Puniceicoccaceae bacterium MED-G30]|jgi:TNF receptor-associated protein 1|nr:MAG: molecular chaperone HtpG [Puniceicoccaceae bacterium MED-G30]RPG87243.1 MAG: molecular chaperone HtpG [Coraliomargarita sp. TMED73]|tara:strand:- start:2503 stop:4377 length:1875 start_codon:yes stop_codon:yes gene_type:complete